MYTHAYRLTGVHVTNHDLLIITKIEQQSIYVIEYTHFFIFRTITNIWIIMQGTEQNNAGNFTEKI